MRPSQAPAVLRAAARRDWQRSSPCSLERRPEACGCPLQRSGLLEMPTHSLESLRTPSGSPWCIPHSKGAWEAGGTTAVTLCALAVGPPLRRLRRSHSWLEGASRTSATRGGEHLLCARAVVVTGRRGPCRGSQAGGGSSTGATTPVCTPPVGGPRAGAAGDPKALAAQAEPGTEHRATDPAGQGSASVQWH